jgi:hypothetical protein
MERYILRIEKIADGNYKVSNITDGTINPKSREYNIEGLEKLISQKIKKANVAWDIELIPKLEREHFLNYINWCNYLTGTCGPVRNMCREIKLSY